MPLPGSERIALLAQCLTICTRRSIHLVLDRIDPIQGIWRFYPLMIERDLSGTVRLVRDRGRIGSSGQEFAEIYADEIAAGEALEAVAR